MRLTGSTSGERARTYESASSAQTHESIIPDWLASGSRPAETDIVECNDYAIWISERETRLDRIATEGKASDIAIDDERYARRSLTTVGTLEGLSKSKVDDPRAANAYRQCMVRRGYNAWG
jgi:hypothetical protein